MIIIQNINSQKFSLNGIPYFKNFMPHSISGKLRIVNIYDTKFELVPFINLNEFSVDGIVYGTTLELQNALLPIIYTRNNLGSATDFSNKLDKGGYTGTAQDLADSIESVLIPDGIIKTGEIVITDLTASIAAADFQWRLSSIEFLNPPAFSIPIDPATDGFNRTDIIEGDNTGNYHLKKGTENVLAAPEPEATDGRIRLAAIPVFGATAGMPVVGIIGEAYIPKSEKASLQLRQTGIVNFIILQSEQTKILINVAVTQVNSIYTPVTQTFLYQGRKLTVQNDQLMDVILKHQFVGGANYTFAFPDNKDLVLKPREIVEFSLRFTTDGHGVYDSIGISTVVPKATDILSGTVKTDVPVADPVVYVKETIDNLLNGKANYFLDIKPITGITYNVILTDILNELVYNGTLPMNVIIPNNTTVPFPIGTIFYALGTNTGIITASGGSGVILSLKSGISLSAIQNEVRQYTKIAVNTWSVRGDLNLGAVTQTELSYLQGVTSSIQAQINAKAVLSGGIANRLMKWLTATTATVSRIWDTGTFLGIGTVNAPTKDVTLGNQSNREIGIEESNNATIGRDLTVRGGRTINYIPNSNFNSLNQLIGGYGIGRGLNGDVYFRQYGGQIYKQTGGVGNFAGYGNAGGGGYAITVALNGDIYTTVNGYTTGDITMQSGGVGAFNIVTTTKRGYYSLSAHINGDVYATAWGLLYRRIGGLGDFVSVTECPEASNVACASNGDVYVTVNGKIYKQTGATGAFVDLLQTTRSYTYITCAPNGNVYIYETNSSDIYMLSVGSSVLVPLNQIISGVNGICFNSFGNTYALTTGEVFFQNNDALGASNLDGGTLKNKAGTGKGTGKSRYEVWTGQKTVSGTDMQIETLREYIDENGYHIYTSMPVYADNAAAVTGGLPVGCEYRTATGVKMIVY